MVEIATNRNICKRKSYTLFTNAKKKIDPVRLELRGSWGVGREEEESTVVVRLCVSAIRNV